MEISGNRQISRSIWVRSAGTGLEHRLREGEGSAVCASGAAKGGLFLTVAVVSLGVGLVCHAAHYTLREAVPPRS